MAHSYSAMFGLPTTGLRFFTVYGPWGRPDMALFRFARAIVDGKPIEIYNQGHHQRDFTYVDDIVEGVVRIVDRVAAADEQWNSLTPDPAGSFAPYRLYNIGSHQPIELLRYIELLEASLGRKAERILKPLQPGDVTDTFADISELTAAIGFRPETPIEVGVRRFVDWFRDYYRVSL
jgi:UDP-glucuronate 4-epimerase